MLLRNPPPMLAPPAHTFPFEGRLFTALEQSCTTTIPWPPTVNSWMRRVSQSTDGTVYHTQGAPSLAGGAYTFVDAEGKQQQIFLSQVTRVVPR
jgi:hypothetical protein